MMTMTLETDDDARAFLVAFEKAYEVEGPNNCAPRPVGQMVPWCVRCPEVFAKKEKAERILGHRRHWELPYDEAAKRYPGLPMSTWERWRLKNGLEV